MNHNLTEFINIADESGSMLKIEEEAIQGYDSFITEQRNNPGEAKVTTVLFSTGVRIVENGVPISEAKSLKDYYHPMGLTALLDAVGKTIDEVGVRLAATPEKERPGKIIVTIMTDGAENASHEYSRDQIFEKISHQRERYNWEFIFLAANQDAIAVGTSLGVSAQNSANYVATPDGVTKGYGEMTRMATVARYANP